MSADRGGPPSILYHYTCGHAADRIAKTRILQPGWALSKHTRATPTAQFLWLTDLDTPDRNALGLTSTILDCDRTEYVARVAYTCPPIQWWMRARREHPELIALELALGAAPMHWFVSWEPVEILDITARTTKTLERK